ncbi:lytic transglycosylase domain-containing protein [Thauera sp. Sel9]|uniref:lytic transglycosylase domain-containing protein n=1 Tax=Thauera sp. Sel9 TaxID=2974299 RepID=UPI0021E1929B|nr:lytic transglycosylase domain-containing protein [Thauera sp. Sel9]MCV2217227.1 lytic transglycosylase domain-containing protein [Thauera sp. Sel9]
MKTGLMAAALCAAGMLLPAAAPAQVSRAFGDDRIVAAHEAVRKGDRDTLDVLAAESSPHVLDAYVRYWRFVNVLARPELPPPAQELDAFLQREAGTVLAERLRAEWLRRLATDGDWTRFAALYPGLQNPDREMRCTAWTARLMTGDTRALDEVALEWRTLDNAPAACDTALRATHATGRVDDDALWRRARHQADTRKPDDALLSWSWLPTEIAPAAADAEQALRSSAAWLDRLPANFAVTRAGRELVLAALTRIAWQDARLAHACLLQLQDRLGSEERGDIQAVIAMHAAIDQMPEAMAFYRAVGNAELTPLQRAWRVRAALRAGDWAAVRTAIEALPESERQQPEWTYWLGRAHAATGRAGDAEALFSHIAAEPHFYGILAAEELGRPFALPASGDSLAVPPLDEAENDPALRRALALYRLGLRTEATREWSWALRGRDETFRLAAAHLALRNELYDRAINSAELSNPRANYALRFLTPYRELIEPQVHMQGLDLGWVYGLMRQESRFVVPARSSAGAQGLMQVMPATGKWVANKIGLRGYHPRQLNDPNTNVLLGTSYMRLILNDLDDHPVLASAGYNAGPGRARRWRDDKPLEAAIYIETIPFNETRDYVKKVMVNAIIYGAMFEHRPQSLKTRLGVIGPRPASE